MSADQFSLMERLAACLLIKKRFAGRKALESEAARGDGIALVRLELALGLATAADVERARNERRTQKLMREVQSAFEFGGLPRGHRRVQAPDFELPAGSAGWEALGYLLAGTDYVARTRMAARRYATQRTIAAIVAPVEARAIDALRELRKTRRAPIDLLAVRQPGYATRVIALRRIRSLVDRAGYREATHQHALRVHCCVPGVERALSSTDAARPADVGLGKAYQRAAYWVTTSQHDWYVSPAILSPAVAALNASAPQGVVYLRTDLRVVQGRGTTLKMQRPGPRGGWS